MYTNTVGAVSINTLALSAVANANVNAVAVRAGAVYAESDAAYCMWLTGDVAVAHAFNSLRVKLLESLKSINTLNLPMRMLIGTRTSRKFCQIWQPHHTVIVLIRLISNKRSRLATYVYVSAFSKIF